MESSRILTYFQNYEKYSKFANIQDVFGDSESSSLAHSFDFKFNTSARSVIKRAIQLPQTPELGAETQRGERIASPSEELSTVDSNTNSISHSDAAGSSHSYKSDAENTENTEELVWRFADPVATPKSRYSIVTSTKLGDQVFADQTNHRPSVSGVEEAGDTLLPVGADRQAGHFSENILTLSQQLTHSPVSGLVNDSPTQNQPLVKSPTRRTRSKSLASVKSAADLSSRVTRSSSATSRSERSVTESERSVEDVRTVRSNAAPPACKLRLVDYTATDTIVQDETGEEESDGERQSFSQQGLTHTLEDGYTGSELNNGGLTQDYEGDADTSFRTPQTSLSDKRPRISDTTYTPMTPNSTARPDDSTQRASSVTNDEGNTQNDTVTLSNQSSLTSRIQNEIADITRTLDKVASAASDKASNDGTFTKGIEHSETCAGDVDKSKTVSGVVSANIGDTYDLQSENGDGGAMGQEAGDTYNLSDHNQNTMDSSSKTPAAAEKSSSSKKPRLSVKSSGKSASIISTKRSSSARKSRKSAGKSGNETNLGEEKNNGNISRLTPGTPVTHVRTVRQRASRASSGKSEAIDNVSNQKSSVEVSGSDSDAVFSAANKISFEDYGNDHQADYPGAEDFDAEDQELEDRTDEMMAENSNNNSRRSRKSSSQVSKSPGSSTKKRKPSYKASISLRRKSSETTSKVIVKKKTSRYSVYDPDMPSVSGSPQHYGEVTSTRTPQPTRAFNRGMRGEKLKNMYNSPHLMKPHMTPRTIQRGLRRSKRTRLPPLRHYAGERPVYQFDKITGAYEITGVDKSDVHNDFIFAHTAELDGKKKKTRRRGSGKPKKRDITLNNVDSDASFSDGEVEILEGDELVSRVLTNNRSEVVFYDLSGAVAKDDAEVKVSKLLQNDFTSCGDLIIAGLCEKLQSRLAGYTVTFTVNEGAVMFVINDTIKKVMKAGACCSVPDGNSYRIKNLWRTEAKLFFVACRISQ